MSERERERERVRLIQVFGGTSHGSFKYFKLKKLGGAVSGLKGDNKSGTA